MHDITNSFRRTHFGANQEILSDWISGVCCAIPGTNLSDVDLHARLALLHSICASDHCVTSISIPVYPVKPSRILLQPVSYLLLFFNKRKNLEMHNTFLCQRNALLSIACPPSLQQRNATTSQNIFLLLQCQQAILREYNCSAYKRCQLRSQFNATVVPHYPLSNKQAQTNKHA